MFCRLYELKLATGIVAPELTEYSDCSESCQFCKSDICLISDDYNKPLNKDKFGWRISIRIKFDKPTKTNHAGVLTDCIQLIHPTNFDVWICKGYKKDMVTEFYVIIHDGKQKEYTKTLDELNAVLLTKYYNGRALKSSDFKE